MAIKLIANYSKRLGLPGYSSHQFSVTAETELIDLGEVQGESTRLYQLLQDAVDREMQTVGFVPGEGYGTREINVTQGRLANGSHSRWECSEKQKELILKLVDENQLDRSEIDHLARQRFGAGVRELNRLQASGLIDELLESTQSSGSSRKPRQGAGKGGRR